MKEQKPALQNMFNTKTAEAVGTFTPAVNNLQLIAKNHPRLPYLRMLIYMYVGTSLGSRKLCVYTEHVPTWTLPFARPGTVVESHAFF